LEATPHLLNTVFQQNLISNTIPIVTNPEMEAYSFNKLPKFESLFRVLSEEHLAKQQINFDEFKISSPE